MLRLLGDVISENFGSNIDINDVNLIEVYTWLEMLSSSFSGQL